MLFFKLMPAVTRTYMLMCGRNQEWHPCICKQKPLRRLQRQCAKHQATTSSRQKATMRTSSPATPRHLEKGSRRKALRRRLVLSNSKVRVVSGKPFLHSDTTLSFCPACWHFFPWQARVAEKGQKSASSSSAGKKVDGRTQQGKAQKV